MERPKIPSRPPFRWAWVLLSVLAVAPGSPPWPTPAGGQVLDASPLLATDPPLPTPYSDPEASFRLLTELRRERPARFDLHIATAREASALAMLAPSWEDRRRLFSEALEAARTAISLDSTRVEAHYWLAATLGLLSDYEGARSRIALAREAHVRALRTLEMDPHHGGGHHILGRLHAAARRLSWASRIVARGLGLGEILREASWESAEYHMRVAWEQDSDQLVHAYELGKLLLEARGKREEGLGILEKVANRRPRHAIDAHYVARARRALDRFTGRSGLVP